MRKLLLFFSLWPFWCYGQLFHDFAGDLSAWKQDSAYFINHNGELRSNGPALTTTIGITTPNSRFANTEWQLYVRLEFSPSASNYCRIYLAADEEDLSQPLNGFYLKIGGEAGTADGIDLYRQNGSSHTKIIDGIDGHAGKEINTLRIKVSRSGTGHWHIVYDTLGGTNFIAERKATDTSTINPKVFGFLCSHTSTRKDKFFFDDISINRLPASISQIEAIDEKRIRVSFTGRMNSESIINPENYQFANPSKISNIFIGPDSLSIVIELEEPLTDGIHQLEILILEDFEGYMLSPQNFSFHYYGYGSLLITEIMADPSPSIGLPELEYLEIYNASSDTINLLGFSVSDPSTSCNLPSLDFSPGNYLLIGPAGLTSFFPPSNHIIELSSFPSLNNSGDSIKLNSPAGTTLFNVNYSDSWYKDNQKKNGGFSLELANINSFCKEKGAWKASENTSGGTPGFKNSASMQEDSDGPVITSVAIVEEGKALALKTSEGVMPKSLVLIEMPAAEINKTEKINDDSVKIYLKNQLKENQVYSLSYVGISDCIGNKSPEGSEISFMVPAKADSVDLRISEILFNPFSYGVDFIEIHNTSGKYLNLNQWAFSNEEETVFIDTTIIINPFGYKVFSTSPENIIINYPDAKEENVVVIEKLPKWPDDEGKIMLINPDGNTCQYFHYHQNYHHPLLEKQDGVSLERISYSISENDPNNWHSAAATSGFATPGYINSQASTNGSIDFFNADPKVISPNGDGNNDYTLINYKLNQEGYIGTMSVFDSEGRFIKKICQNQTFGIEGLIKWDGTDENNTRVSTGYYLILLEIFNMAGDRLKLKTSVAVSNID